MTIDISRQSTPTDCQSSYTFEPVFRPPRPLKQTVLAAVGGVASACSTLGVRPDVDHPRSVEVGTRRRFEHRGVIQGAPERVFPLLCPVLEYAWLDGWRAEMIHSRSGVAEEGVVFRTRFQLGETWVCTRYEPSQRIQYTVFAGAAVMVLDITLAAAADGACEICWTRTYTATTRVGRRLVRRLEPDQIEAELATLNACLNHYLATGRMLPRRGAPA